MIENEDFIAGEGKEIKTLFGGIQERNSKAKIKLKKISKLSLIVGPAAGGSIAPTLFKDLGIELIELYSDVDGEFPIIILIQETQ